MSLSARQRHEREYYDKYVHYTGKQPPLQPLRLAETRAFNPYWYIMKVIKEEFRDPTQRLLDFGCGPGRYGVMAAQIGFNVYGFDISIGNVVAARALAARYKMTARAHFCQGVAESLCYPDNFFDVIAGVDILHHVDIPTAIRECRRVLKPGGLATFKEPLEAVLFEPIRRSWLGRRIAPQSMSFERHITEDERKISRGELAAIAREFPSMRVERFRLLSRLEPFLGRRAMTPEGASRIEPLDRQLLRLGCFKPLAGAGVLLLRKES